MKKFIASIGSLILINSIIISLFVVNSNIKSPDPIYMNTNFNVTYEFPFGDVESSNGTQTSDRKDIDIIQLKSNKSNDNRYLILKLQVAGEIRNSRNIEYKIYIRNDIEDYYIINYENGNCKGNFEDKNRYDNIKVNIRNSNTLEIKLPLEKLRSVSEFSLNAESYEETKNEDYFDYGINVNNWGRFIYIIEPFSGSTVFKNCTIRGILNNYDERLFKSINVQINSLDVIDWELASTTDNWSTWSYQWNTETVPNGKYVIFARAFDGYTYFFNSIIVYVDQEAVANSKTAEIPNYHIGDYYYYVGITYLIDLPINETGYWEYFSIPEDVRNGKITNFNSVSINGTHYEAYVREHESEYKDPYNENDYYLAVNSTTWIRKSDLAILKREFEVKRLNDKDECVNHFSILITYDYPSGYNKYPLKVGRKWENIVIMKYTFYNITPNKKIEELNFTLSKNIYNECLRTDTKTFSTHTFEVYIIVSYLNFSSMEWYENSEKNRSEKKHKWYFDGYDIEYYSPEIGNCIDYDVGQLVSYKYGNEYGNESYAPGYEVYSPKLGNLEISFLIVTLAMVNTIYFSTIFITSTEIGKYGFFKAISILLTKRKKKRYYNYGFIKGSVRGVIYTNPGVNYTSIKKILNLSNGTLSHYLKSLEKEGIIKSERDGLLKRFYPTIGWIGSETLDFSDVQREIYNIIHNNPGISQKEIIVKLDTSQQRLNYHIQLMVNARIIKFIKEGNKSKYFIIEKET